MITLLHSPSASPPPSILPSEILLTITQHYLTTITNPKSTYPVTHPFHNVYWIDAAVIEVINYLAVFPNMRTPLYKLITSALLQIRNTRAQHTVWLEASRRADDQAAHNKLWKELWEIRRVLACEEECLLFLREKMWMREVEMEKELLCRGDISLRQLLV